MGLFEDITSKVEAWGQAENYFEGPLKSSYIEKKHNQYVNKMKLECAKKISKKRGTQSIRYI